MQDCGRDHSSLDQSQKRLEIDQWLGGGRERGEVGEGKVLRKIPGPLGMSN